MRPRCWHSELRPARCPICAHGSFTDLGEEVRMKPEVFRAVACAGLAAAALSGITRAAPAAHQYRIAHEVSLPGDGGWDDLTFDDGGHRLFIAHGTQVQVVDTDKLTLAGSIADTPGVHATALATDVGHGYISAGRSGTI